MGTADLKRELFSICDAVIKGNLESAEALQSLRTKVLENDVTLTSHLFDVLTGFATLPLDGERKDNATQFFKAVSHEFLPDDILKLELPQLGADTFKSKIIKAKTKIYYKQLKFNLFREESEGYAKLVTELLTVQPKDDAASVFERVSQLIGQFNLDPNRVVDLILDCFACNFDSHRIFVRVLELFKIEADVLKRIVLLKLIMLKKAGHTPNTIYRVIVMLFVSGMLNVKEIFQAVQPTREEFVEELKKQRSVLAQRVSRAQTISTLATIQTEEASSNGLSSALNEGLSSGGSGGQTRSFSSVTNAQEVEDQKAGGDSFDEYVVVGRNQKLGLLVASAEIGALNLVYQLIPLFPEHYPLGSSKRFAKALCQIFEYIIEPFYRKTHQSTWPNGTQPSTYWESTFVERPECMTNWNELTTRLLPLLKILGPYLGTKREAGLKFMSILSAFFDDEQAKSMENYQELTNLIYSIVDFCLLPSVSIGDPSFTYNEALWAILSRVPYQGRYWMYGRWKSTHSNDSYELQIQRGKVIGRMKYIMKRMTKETVKVAGRQLGKVCLTHPTIAFDYMLDRVQSFQNLIGPVVESMRYLSDLAFDVLSYSLIESLAQPSKQGLKTGDGSLSAWLVALATFAGAVYRRYTVEYEGILQYVTNQLKNGKSVDLMVLREVVTATAGFEPTNSLTADQLSALCSGELLRQEVIGNGIQKGRRQAISRLRDVLMRTDLCESLAILLAQQKNIVIYKETSGAPVKLASQMVDQCQESFMQFVNFLRSHIKPEEYVKRIPLITSLFNDYHLPPESAFFLARSNYSTKTLNLFDSLKKVEKEVAETKKLDANKKKELYTQALSEVINSTEEELTQCMPNDFWTNTTAKLYTFFWLLSASDIYVDVDLYNREIERVRKEREEVPKSDLSKTRRAREEERLKTLEQKLSQELSRQQEHVERVTTLIKETNDQFFSRATTHSKNFQLENFIQYCLIPRCTFSEADAVYCAKFVQFLHETKTEYFNTFIIFDKIFNDMIPVLLTASENEGAAFGKFVSLLLEASQRWYESEELFNAECATFSSCHLKIRKDSEDDFTLDVYRSICYKWQLRLLKTLVQQALSEKSSYLLVRNAFLVLNKILNYFPLITTYVSQIEDAATAVRDREKNKRLDLSVMAQSYLVHLKKRTVKVYDPKDFGGKSNAKKESSNAKSSKASVEKSTPNGKSASKEKTPSSDRKTTNDKSSTASTTSTKTPVSEKRSSSSDKKSSDKNEKVSSDKKSSNEKSSEKKIERTITMDKKSIKEEKSVEKEKKSEKTREKPEEKRREKSPPKEKTLDKKSNDKPSNDKSEKRTPIRQKPSDKEEQLSVDRKSSSNGRSAEKRKMDRTPSIDKKPIRETSTERRTDKVTDKGDSKSSRGSKRRETNSDTKQEPKSKRRYEKT